MRILRTTRATLSGGAGATVALSEPPLLPETRRSQVLRRASPYGHNQGHEAALQRGRHASSPAAGRGRVPPLRRPLREGRVPGARASSGSARSSTRTRSSATRTSGACRRCTTSRSTAQLLEAAADARGLGSAPSRDAARRSDVRGRGRRDLRSACRSDLGRVALSAEFGERQREPASFDAASRAGGRQRRELMARKTGIPERRFRLARKSEGLKRASFAVAIASDPRSACA